MPKMCPIFSILPSFCLRNNTKPKQESFEFKAPPGPPPQPPTQVSPQVRKDTRVIHPPVASFTHPSISCLHQTPQQFQHPNQHPTHIHIRLLIHPSSCSSNQTSIHPLSLHASTHPPSQGQTKCIFIYLFSPLRLPVGVIGVHALRKACLLSK